MLYQVTMHDLQRDEIRNVDVPADSEDNAVTAARRQYPASVFAVLFVQKIGNPHAVSKWPLRSRKPKQVELMI